MDAKLCCLGRIRINKFRLGKKSARLREKTHFLGDLLGQLLLLLFCVRNSEAVVLVFFGGLSHQLPEVLDGLLLGLVKRFKIIR